jgi:hypothetical protein
MDKKERIDKILYEVREEMTEDFDLSMEEFKRIVLRFGRYLS